MQNKTLRIAIDLTPLQPGGENGGAKVLVINLLKQLQKLSLNCHFLILTSSANHSELSEYKTENTSLKLVLKQITNEEANKISKFVNKVKNKIISKLNISIYQSNILEGQNIDLLFCPFSAPTYAQNNIPLVAIVHDLQHLEYPLFFSPQERQHRTIFLNNLVKKSQKLVCVSDFTRRAFIQKLNTPEEKLAVVPNCIHERLPKLSEVATNRHLINLGIGNRKYAFYPANYWQHKNHRFLLAAYGVYKKQFPNEHLDLVFTGALEKEENRLKEAARIMNVSENVHFLGFLNEEALAAVWQGSTCLIFPSLYEGFGIPLLEAMRFGKPVLCSDTASLPEVGSDAVLYFNPRKIEEIVSCLARITNDEILVEQLVAKGYKRLELFNSEEMAHQYLKIFETVVDSKASIQNMISNVYDDGWSAPKFSISIEAGSSGRQLEIIVEVPDFYPASTATIKLITKHKKDVHKCLRGSSQKIVWSLSELGEVITVKISPYFVPNALNLNSDNRQLGLMVRSCQIRLIDGTFSQAFNLESLV